MADRGAAEAPEDRTHFDCLIVGTGLTESILAAYGADLPCK